MVGAASFDESKFDDFDTAKRLFISVLVNQDYPTAFMIRR